MPQRARPRLQRLLGAALAWVLALLVLQAQALGLWHRVAHGGPHAEAVAHAAASEADAFGHAADDESLCRLYDAVGQAGTPAAEVRWPAVQPPAAACSRVRLPVAALDRAHLYEARAPPG